jgi:type IV pilus assembly protein PilW
VIPRRAAAGVTLVELMIALALGLIVAGAAMSLFLSTRQTYIASESLARIQENSRVAFELMARDLREAASNSCGGDLSAATNVLNAPASHWYTDASAGIRGYDGTTPFGDAAFGVAAGQRASGTQALEMLSAQSDGITIKKHNPAAASFEVNTTAHKLAVGDIAVACDPVHAAIFQVTNASPGINANIVHNTGSGTPGNCTKGLGSPVACSPATGSSYQFGCAYGGTDASKDCSLAENKWTAFLARLQAIRWYVGCNGRVACTEAGGRSLYRSRLVNAAGVPGVQDDEIVEGVTGLTVGYLVDGAPAYAAAGGVGDWSKVVALDMALQMSGLDRVDGTPIQRTLHHVVALRSRAP